MINEKKQEMYELAYSQSDLVKQELLDFAGSLSAYGKGVEDNINLLNKCFSIKDTFIGNIKAMVELGLKYSSGDYYIFIQKGGNLKIAKSPNGSAKVIDRIISSKDVKATLVMGIVRDSDEVTMTTDGTIQTINIKRGKDSIFKRDGIVIGGYGIVTVFSKTNSMLSRNVILIDSTEYNAIKKMALNAMRTYESMFMNKIILRRYAQLLPAFIGGGFTPDEIEILDEVREENRVDRDNVPPIVEPKEKKLELFRGLKELKTISSEIKNKGLNFIEECKKLGYVADKDIKLSEILMSLTDEEYKSFLEKIRKGDKNV